MGRSANIVAKAPGKFILLGEHAVSRGHPAIVCAVDKYMTTEVELIDEATNVYDRSIDDDVKIELVDLGYFGNLKDNQADSKVTKSLQVIKKAFELCHVSASKLAKITVTSDIHMGSGMGSSAAFCVSVAAALCRISTSLCDERKVFEIARELEHIFHGFSSGLDVFASVYGGCLVYRLNCSDVTRPSLSGKVMIIDSLVQRSTKNVNKLFIDQNGKDLPEARKKFEAIGEIIERFLSHDLTIFEAINQNGNILSSLGLMVPEMKAICRILSKYNYACKLTGAGLGGCMIAYSSDTFSDACIQEIIQNGFSIITTIDLCNPPSGLQVTAE